MFPSNVWDGTLLSSTGFAAKDDEILEQHLSHSLAKDLLKLTSELTSTQDYLFQKYKNLSLNIEALNIPATQSPNWVSYKDAQVLEFSDQSVEVNEEKIYFSVKIPRAYKESSDIYFNIHWIGENDTVGVVRWGIKYSWANIGEEFPDSTLLTVNSANTGLHTRVQLQVDGTDKLQPSVLIGQLFRNSSHVDDDYSNAYLVMFDVVYQVERLGTDSNV
jgi:hypothetical protein